jgi:hypothetical protein
MPGREKEDDRGGPLVGDREQGRWSGLRLGQDVGGLRPSGGCGGLAKRPGGTGRLKRMGLAQLERKFIYFPNLIFSAKIIPGKPRNCLRVRKILRKSQKFQENS